MAQHISMNVDSQSYKHLMARLQVIERRFPEMAVKVVQAAGLTIESNAKINLSKELIKSKPNEAKGRTTFHGALSASLHRVDYQNGVAVSAKKGYAAYVEFGTGETVSIPSGWETYASKFKGAGIRKVNNRPRPYLVKAFIEETPKVIDRIRKVFKQL